MDLSCFHVSGLINELLQSLARAKRSDNLLMVLNETFPPSCFNLSEHGSHFDDNDEVSLFHERFSVKYSWHRKGRCDDMKLNAVQHALCTADKTQTKLKTVNRIPSNSFYFASYLN